jgi:hypothetical protein
MSLRERVRRLSGERRVERQMTEAQRQFAWRRMVLKAQFVMRHVHATDTLQYLMPAPSATDAPASSSANAGTAHCALAGGVDNRVPLPRVSGWMGSIGPNDYYEDQYADYYSSLPTWEVD